MNRIAAGMSAALSRRRFLSAASLSALGVALAPHGTKAAEASRADGKGACGATAFAFDSRGVLRLTVPGLTSEVRVCLASDTHLALHDARDAAYADNYARMAQWPGKPSAFAGMLAKARENHTDLVALTGDIVSFPTLANVEFVAGELEKCGLEWLYTAGNHDWHFEGDGGTDAEQRAAWTKRRLAPLYRGADPLMSVKVVKGVRFVAIDNSVYHITPAQLAFWRTEVAKGDPTVLLMHVPLWVEGFGVYTCGNPNWGTATDAIWQIERRQPWAARQSAESFALREAVLSAPNLVAVFTGHIHRGLQAVERGKFLFTVPCNREGVCWDVRLVPPA